jgi:hypothetical protein
MKNWIEEFHNLTMQKNQNENIELTKKDIKTLQNICNEIHTQARLEQFHCPELQALIAYVENLYFLK